jgi:hypothetical protein
MNDKLLKLLGLIKKYNGGEISLLLEEEFKAFADYEEPIETIDSLIEAMEDEMTYWED